MFGLIIVILVTCGLQVLRLNEDKLLNWLKMGVDKICKTAYQLSDSHQISHLKAILPRTCCVSAVAPSFIEGMLLFTCFLIFYLFSHFESHLRVARWFL